MSCRRFLVWLAGLSLGLSAVAVGVPITPAYAWSCRSWPGSSYPFECTNPWAGVYHSNSGTWITCASSGTQKSVVEKIVSGNLLA